jgi:phosphate starvation-inducible PhoH-like protein
MHALRQVAGIEFVEFGERDVVRHPLVQSIIQAYKRHREGSERALKRHG